MRGSRQPEQTLSTEQKRAMLARLLREQAAQPESIPLSFNQERLWFLHQLEPRSPVYNLSLGVRLTGTLNREALQRALTAIVARHEALRTTFAHTNDATTQIINDPRPVESALTDLSGLPGESREIESNRLLEAEARLHFDLKQGPLFRVKLFRLADREHVLLTNFHHIVSDGWSVGIFFRELTALYEAFAAGKPSPLSELPIQYADFAAWQREHFRGRLVEAQLAWWKQQLAGDCPPLALPTDHPRPPIQTFNGACEPFALPDRLAESLKRFGQRERATLFMVVLAAFQTWLHRYTGQDEIAVGTPVAGRPRAELEGLIGFFANTLVLRVSLRGNPTFRELLRRVRETALGVYDHQDLPFEKLVEELNPQRSLNRHPLFQVMLVLHGAQPRELESAGLRMRRFDVATGTAKFDLTLALMEEDGGLSGAIEYDTDLFEAATIRHWVGHLRTLLEGIAANPDQPIGELPLLSEAERHQLLVEWNNTRAEYPRDKCVHELFEEQAKRTPDATAVIWGRERATYRELNRRAEQLAERLRALGVGPDVLVGICLDRTVEMVVAILGVLKAGGAYVPLDPAYPRDRLAFVIQDARMPVVLTQKKLLPGLPQHGAKVLCVDAAHHTSRITSYASRSPDKLSTPKRGVAPTGLYALNPEKGRGPHGALRPQPRKGARPPRGFTPSTSLAYVLYTSGSTGRPKGVAVEHHGVVALIFWALQLFQPADLCGVLASTSICFDLSVFELFVPLSSGGAVILADNALELPSLPAAREVTLINTVPSAIAELLRLDAIPDSVRVVNLAGEPLSQQWVEQLYQRPHVQRVFDLYGPTEDTVYSTFALRRPGGRATIGRPIANERIFILDRNLQPVPVGVAGELFIGGDGLARGYLNRPDLTAEKFIENPFQPGQRLYRTGDLARYGSDGDLEFLGRLDHQIKLRGYRIELGEIESVLRAHLAVCEAAVAVKGGADRSLVAYVVPNPDRALDTGELRRHLQRNLPDYMVPSVFVTLEKLPLTPNGKVDRKALSMLEGDRSAATESYVAPATPTEEGLARIWCEVLGLERVGVHDNFFELGGHSLLVTRVVLRIRERFGAELPLRRLFESPTVAALACAIEDTLINEITQLSEEEAIEIAGRA